MKLQAAARQVLETWEHGDLATSVRNLALALETDDRPRLLENLAAITSGLYGDKRWHEMYMGVRSSVGGFPGVWQLCIEASQEFTDEETLHEADAFEWIRAVELFADEILTAPPDELTNRETSSFYLRNLAKVAIAMSSGDSHGEPLPE